MTKPHRSSFGFSFASMLIGMGVLSLVVYSTVYPSVWAASLGFSLAIGILSLALFRVLAASTNRRYWLAFSLAGFAYLGMLYLPVVDERVGSWMISTTGFAGLEGAMYEESADRAGNPQRVIVQQRARAKYFLQNAMGPNMRRSGSPFEEMLPQETWAGRVFHSMFALVCGLAAGWVVMLPLRRINSSSEPTNVE